MVLVQIWDAEWITWTPRGISASARTKRAFQCSSCVPWFKDIIQIAITPWRSRTRYPCTPEGILNHSTCRSHPVDTIFGVVLSEADYEWTPLPSEISIGEGVLLSFSERIGTRLAISLLKRGETVRGCYRCSNCTESKSQRWLLDATQWIIVRWPLCKNLKAKYKKKIKISTQPRKLYRIQRIS